MRQVVRNPNQHGWRDPTRVPQTITFNLRRSSTLVAADHVPQQRNHAQHDSAITEDQADQADRVSAQSSIQEGQSLALSMY